MRISTFLLTTGLCTLMIFSGYSYADDMTKVPKDYPSHDVLGNCFTAQQIQPLQQKLVRYNETRLEISTVLRKLADEYKLTGDTRQRLLGFAETFEQMKKELPKPDPDSAAFRNFDFKLGMALTAMQIFLNTNTDTAERFYNDRDNKTSELGIYLAALDNSRETYMDSLKSAESKQSGKSTCGHS